MRVVNLNMIKSYHPNGIKRIQRINLNQYADTNDYKNMTKKINGGFIGLEDRIHHIEKAMAVLQS